MLPRLPPEIWSIILKFKAEAHKKSLAKKYQGILEILGSRVNRRDFLDYFWDYLDERFKKRCTRKVWRLDIFEFQDIVYFNKNL